jgi:branched-chain amino acid transport system ATP-binding protein
MSLLRVQNLTKFFGGLTAVNNVSLAVEERSIFGLIGPNGSGKTVTFDCITGFQKPEHGRIFFQNREITGRRPNQIALRGVGRSFQLTGVFTKLTVYQNLIFAAQEKTLRRNCHISLRPGKGWLPQERIKQMDEVLEFTGLRRMKEEVVANLPYGQQKILEFASLMVMNPDPVLYMLDEPLAGLTGAEIASYLSLMRERRGRGRTFLLVEHNMRAVMDICDRIVVLDHGEKIAEGSPGEIQANQRVVEAYLGHGGLA